MRTRRLVGIAGLLLTGASSTAPAQGIFVDGPNGSMADVWVTLLGGSASFAHQLYLFRNPVNFAAPAGGEMVGLAKSAANKEWSPTPVEIHLGRFAAGSELLFGLLVNGGTW